MEAKEGILLDRDGTTILEPESVREERKRATGFQGRLLRFHVSNNPVVLLLLPVFFILALLLVAIGMMVMIPVWVIRAIFR